MADVAEILDAKDARVWVKPRARRALLQRLREQGLRVERDKPRRLYSYERRWRSKAEKNDQVTLLFTVKPRGTVFFSRPQAEYMAGRMQRHPALKGFRLG